MSVYLLHTIPFINYLYLLSTNFEIAKYEEI
jgi:hypothetical protein